jgi:glutathione S-transferase
MRRIHHLALRSDWEEAVATGGPYRRSTLGKSLDEVGFIHCSFAEQVEQTAELFYRGRDDIVLLTIDAGELGGTVRVEAGFPHIYGELPLAAVVSVEAWPTGSAVATRPTVR